MLFSLRFVWEKLKGRRWMLFVGAFLSLVRSVAVILNPLLSKELVDVAIVNNDHELLIRLLIFMCLIVLGRTLLLFARKAFFELASQKMIANIRMTIFDNIQNQEMSFFDKIRAGDLITRSNSDIHNVRHFVAYTSFVIVETPVIFLSAAISLMFISPVLTIALLLALPILGISSKLYSKKVAPIYRDIRQNFAQLNVQAQENIAGNRVVKAFAAEAREIEKFDTASLEFKEQNLRAAYAWNKILPIIEFLAQSLTLITLLVGGLLVINGSITIGELSVFTSLTWALALPMRSVSSMLNDYQRFKTSAVKIIELCEQSPLIADRPDAVKAEGRLSGKIEFKNVSFSYKVDSKKVLDSVSFVAEHGETVAIMGPTGSGKSTLINLISRFYDATEGEVLLDGVNVKMRRLEDIRKSVAVASQDVFLFSDTVEGNIAYSNPDMPTDKVERYATYAAADDFIRDMEESYDTIIGERGVGISGGQRQRLALARAMAAEAPILILDDTTSAVDMETEKLIQKSLRDLPAECTKIIIAQRISSVKHADKILILENGKVTIGNHKTLAAENEYYRNICELQDVKDLPTFVGQTRKEEE